MPSLSTPYLIETVIGEMSQVRNETGDGAFLAIHVQFLFLLIEEKENDQ